MRIFLVASIAILVLTACSKPEEMSVEEQIMVNAFAGYVSAGTYDRVCNGAKLANTDVKKNPEFAIYMGNRQLFGARMGVLWKMRNPEGTLEEGVKSLVSAEKNIDKKVEKSLKDNGCDSEAGQQGKKMYDLYTKTHPAVISGLLDKTITDQGGKITPPDAID